MLLLVMSSAAALDGEITLINHTECTITPHLDGFAQNKMITFSGEKKDHLVLDIDLNANTTRQLTIPISISCDKIRYSDKIQISAQHSQASLSIDPAHSFTPIQLIISGENKVDSQNRSVTILALPQKLAY